MEIFQTCYWKGGVNGDMARHALSVGRKEGGSIPFLPSLTAVAEGEKQQRAEVRVCGGCPIKIENREDRI
jgi:hypothetical protein